VVVVRAPACSPESLCGFRCGVELAGVSGGDALNGLFKMACRASRGVGWVEGYCLQCNAASGGKGCQWVAAGLSGCMP
jgi:hypothetical protein